MTQPESLPSRAAGRTQGAIAVLAIAAIALHLLLRYALRADGEVFGLPAYDLPLAAALLLGGVPLVLGLSLKLLRGEFGSDLLAGLSIVTSVLLREYLAGALVVLMLSGGEALEAFAVRRALAASPATSGPPPSRRAIPSGRSAIRTGPSVPASHP